MSIPLKFKLSSEESSAYATTKSGTGNATLNVLCPSHNGRAQRTQSFGVSVGTVTQPVNVTQAGAAVQTYMFDPAGSVDILEATDTSISIEGSSNSAVLTFSLDSTNALGASIGTPRWMEESDTDTGSNGTTFTNGTAIADDPGQTRIYKFVITLSFPVNTGATSRSSVLTVTDSAGTSRTATITQAGDAYLSVSPSSFVAPAAAGSQTFTLSTNGTPSVSKTGSGFSITTPTRVDSTTWTATLTWESNPNNTARTLGSITFSISEDANVKQILTLTQTYPSSNLVIVGSESSVIVGHTLELQALDSVNHSGLASTWTVSDNTKASVSGNNTYRCTVTALAAGSVTVYATKDGYATASYSLTVQANTGTAVVIENGAASASVRVGKTLQLQAGTQMLDGTFDEQDTYTWSSNNTSKATVTSSGVVSGIAAGNGVTVSAVSNNYPSLSDTITVNVLAAPNLILSIRLYVQRNGSNHWIAQYYQVIAQTSNGATTTKNVTLHSFDIIEDSGSETTLYTVPCNITLDLDNETNKESAQQSITAYDFGTDIENMFTRSSDFTVNSGEAESIVPTSIDDSYFEELS